MTAEESKESSEKQAAIYFNLYLAAEGNQEYEEALSYINNQQKILKAIHGEKHTRICSNYYIQSKLYMKLLKLEESMEVLQKAFDLKNELEAEFAEDLPVVSAKYFLQNADLTFMTRKYNECIQACEKGVEQVQIAASKDEDLLAHMNDTRR